MTAARDICIDVATTPAQFDLARALILEYADWLAVDLAFQDHETEIADIERVYGPPMGRLFLAMVDGAAAGCMAVHPLPVPGEGELKRLYVRPDFRGLGLGRIPLERTVEAAREIGYRVVRFDTWPERMPEPQAMYRRLGCVETPPYYDNPVKGVIFMKLDLE
jgi:GNAT superfamily N-acetyltransferase